MKDTSNSIQGVIKWYWQRLGESAALGPSVVWLYFPLGLLGPVLLETSRLGGSIGSWIVVGLVGQVAIFVCLWCARRIIHRTSASQSRPLANLVAILIAVGLRGISVAWAAKSLTLTENFDLAYRLNAAFFTQAGLLLTVAVIVSSFSFRRQLANNLWSQQEQLRKLNSSMQDRLAEVRRTLAEQVRKTIDPLIEEINRGLDQVGTGEDPMKLRDSICKIIDEQLRPLSHDLESQTGRDSEPPGISSDPQATRIPLPLAPPISLLMRPVATSFIVALLAASPGLLSNGIFGAMLYPVVAFVITTPILYALRVPIGSWRLPLWMGIPLVFVVTGLGVGLTKIYIAERILTFPDTISLVAFIGGGLAGILAAAFALANDGRSLKETELKISIEKLQLQLSILRQHEFVTRRELSYILHGGIQSALHVAAMRLASHEELDVNLLSTIRGDIELATARLELPSSSDELLIEMLSDIAELWDGTCSVKWTLDHRTTRMLVDAPIAASCIVEIMRECVGNAIRHGRATEVWITIQGTDDRFILTSLDNGTAKTDWKPGLGSKMMTEMCVSWSHAVVSTGTKVTAEVATPIV